MGRLDSAPSQNMMHFSHPHELELCNGVQNEPSGLFSTPPCTGCKLPPSGNMYICRPCNFTLHLTCAQFPQFITHPSHPKHTLTLRPTSSYPGGVFNCDACNRQGNGFSYHCGSCEYDLHMICASMPLNITIQFHSCPLELTFKNPYDNANGFSCDICRKIGSKQWLYRCSACEFDVHLDCTTASPAPAPVIHSQAQVLLQHHRSFPGAIVQNQVGIARPNQYMHSASMGANVIPHQHLQPMHVATGQVNAPIRPNFFVHSASTGSLIQNMQQPARTNNLMNSVIQGVVEGASQQVGQSLIQSIIGGGNSSGGGGGGEGSSILGSIFGDSSDIQN